jgi:ubiquitin-conjugating enzyme E2 variant
MTTILLQVCGMWLVADFITGVVHWWEDAYGNPAWPILGTYIIEPNLKHHSNPRALLQGSYWQRINTSLYAVLVLIGVFWFLGWHSPMMVICLLMCSQGNELHAISHRTDKENGKWVCRLQKIGIVQRRKTHGWHHKAPYDTNFCVMTEYLNPVLNALHFWQGMEWLIAKLGVPVLRGSAVRNGL